MITFDELNTQNHKITELSNVLLYLFEDRSMCDTESACNLFFKYIERVTEHLTDVDHLYAVLLTDKNQEVNNIANRFMSGEQEIKRIIAKYVKTWCNKKRQELVIADHDKFLKDTQEIFHMILARIQDETEKMYPLVREIRGDEKHAA
jgi:hypothetical protein